MSGEREATSLELLADYECPECGPLVEDSANPLFSEREASEILGGDENGFLRCPDCGEELEPTLDATLDMMAMIAERIPELAPEIAGLVESVAEGLS